MNTPGRNLGSVEGIVDVSILIPACFENPLREDSVNFISQALTQRRKAIIPLFTVIGAYHITTRDLKVPKMHAKTTLTSMIKTGSPALFGNITEKTTSDALDYASSYGIESWDGVLVALCRSMGSTIIYSLDQELNRVKEITAVNPFQEEKVQKYHEYINSIIG